MTQLALAEGTKRRRRKKRRKWRVFLGTTGKDEAAVMLKRYDVKIKGSCLNDCAFFPQKRNGLF